MTGNDSNIVVSDSVRVSVTAYFRCSLTSDPGSCSNPIGIAALLSSLHTRLATYRSVLASLESAHCQSVDGIRSLGEATDTVGDLYMLLARVHGSISEQCMSLLSMVRVAPVLTSQQLSVLSSWYTVVSVENGVVEAGSRHSIPRRTLVSEQSWLSAVDDHEMRAAEFCRSAIDAFTRCNHVTKMRECLLLAGQLNGDRLIRLVQNGRADRFPLLCDVLTQLYSRLSATSSEVDTISLNAVRCEVNAWTAIGEAALSSVVQTAETTKRVIAVASNALQALLKCVPVLRAQCVNTCDDAWTDLYTGLLWALKHLTKLSPDKVMGHPWRLAYLGDFPRIFKFFLPQTLYKHVYTIAFTNPKGRTSAADLLADILECVVPSKAAL